MAEVTSSLMVFGRDAGPWTSKDLSLDYQLRHQAWLHLLTEATALPPFWLASSIVTRRCDRPSGSRECFLASLE